MAAGLLKIGIDEAKKLRKSKDKDFDRARQLAKVANFGFPGGLGPTSLVSYAASSGTVITLGEAKELLDAWLKQWPEMPKYFRHIREQLVYTGKEDESGKSIKLAKIQQVRSGRWRAEAFYTEACNSYFQGLGADATSRAHWYLTNACYNDRSSALYGCHVVNFIHDEFFIECPDDPNKYRPAGKELVRLMCKGADELLPDVPTSTEEVVMRYWSKAAQRVEVDGLVYPWFDNCHTKGCNKPLIEVSPETNVCTAGHEN
jgi:DNA polymerase-1